MLSLDLHLDAFVAQDSLAAALFGPTGMVMRFSHVDVCWGDNDFVRPLSQTNWPAAVAIAGGAVSTAPFCIAQQNRSFSMRPDLAFKYFQDERTDYVYLVMSLAEGRSRLL